MKPVDIFLGVVLKIHPCIVYCKNSKLRFNTNVCVSNRNQNDMQGQTSKVLNIHRAQPNSRSGNEILLFKTTEALPTF